MTIECSCNCFNDNVNFPQLQLLQEYSTCILIRLASVQSTTTTDVNIQM